MTHVQLRRKKSGDRVLPVFYDGNYVSLVPNEQRTITIEADENLLNGEDALVDGGWMERHGRSGVCKGRGHRAQCRCAAGPLAGNGPAVPD